jgi:hypothetical protein
MSDSPQTFQRSDHIARVNSGHVAFYGHNSWYRVPPHLEPIFRTAKETRREVKFTTDRDCNIHAVEVLPAPPSAVGRFGRRATGLAMRLMPR